MCIDNYDFMFIRDNAFVKMLQKIILLSYNQSMNEFCSSKLQKQQRLFVNN